MDEHWTSFFVAFVIQVPSIFYDIKIQIFCLCSFLPTSNFRSHKIAPINLFDAIVHTTHSDSYREKLVYAKRGKRKIVPMRRTFWRWHDFLSLYKFPSPSHTYTHTWDAAQCNKPFFCAFCCWHEWILISGLLHAYGNRVSSKPTSHVESIKMTW
jgi:hypothetical protein